MLMTDKDPVLSARSIPIELIEYTLEGIVLGYAKAQEQSYKRINKISSLAKLVCSDLTYSNKNCCWYNLFYNELCNIAKDSGLISAEPLQISGLKVKSDSMFIINPLSLHSPLLDEKYQEVISKKEELYSSLHDVTLISRNILVDLDPTFDDFVKGIPAWYTNLSNTLILSYDTFSRRHIKIIKDGERLRYYTSVISDDWKEVQNVPSEMDFIIKYLISNRANLTFTNE